jgi:hypothetical protein
VKNKHKKIVVCFSWPGGKRCTEKLEQGGCPSKNYSCVSKAIGRTPIIIEFISKPREG